MNFKRKSKSLRGKRWDHRRGLKRALRTRIDDASAKRDTMRAGRRGWGLGIGK